ncbi:MAG: helicase, partial [Candidatus Adiutrix sp.]|nr:helicase [Candidatus Adiutrix sp.]
QTIQAKAEGIEQFRKGDSLARSIEDVSGEAANAAEMKAAATGNELIFTQVKLASELKKLEGLYNSFMRSQHQLERRIADLEQAPERLDRIVADYEREIEHRNRNSTTEPYFAVAGKVYGQKNRKELLWEVARVMKKVSDKTAASLAVGEYRGFKVSVEPGLESGSRQFAVEGRTGRHSSSTLGYRPGDDFNINGFLQRLDNFLDKFESKIEEALETKKKKAAELQTACQSRGRRFPQMALLEALKADNREVMVELQKMRKAPAYKSAWEPSSSRMSEAKAGKHNIPVNENASSAIDQSLIITRSPV